MQYSKGISSTIKLLIRFGFQVLVIGEMFYIIKSFDEANNNSWKHHLIGKDITSMIEDYNSIHSLDDSKREQLTTKIESLPLEEVFFHKDIQFILHLLK